MGAFRGITRVSAYAYRGVHARHFGSEPMKSQLSLRGLIYAGRKWLDARLNEDHPMGPLSGVERLREFSLNAALPLTVGGIMNVPWLLPYAVVNGAPFILIADMAYHTFKFVAVGFGTTQDVLDSRCDLLGCRSVGRTFGFVSAHWLGLFYVSTLFTAIYGERFGDSFMAGMWYHEGLDMTDNSEIEGSTEKITTEPSESTRVD